MMITAEIVRPMRCEECHSSSLVPVIEGHPDNDLLALVFLRKIIVCGSFAISNGSAIWACSECGTRVTDKKYCYDEKNRALLVDYEKALQDAFNAYVPIDHSELRKLKGASFLRSLAREFFAENIDHFMLEKQENCYQIITYIGGHQNTITSSLFTPDRFDQMIEYIGNENKAAFTVRINKKEMRVVAKIPSLQQIQVVCDEAKEKV